MTVLQWIAAGAAAWVGLSVPTALVVGPLLGRRRAETSVVPSNEVAEVAR